jgi:tetratricopeptide (TPR) repeat protein
MVVNEIVLLTDLGVSLRDSGDFLLSLDLLDEALKLAELSSGESSLDVANILLELSRTNCCLSDYSNAEECIARSSRIQERIPGHRQNQLEIVKLATNTSDCLATVRRLQGRYDEALKILKARLGKVYASLRINAPLLLEFHQLAMHCGMLHKYMFQFRKAESCYKLALRYFSETQSYPKTLADLYYNLGGLEHARNMPSMGVRWATLSIRWRCSNLKSNHPDIAIGLTLIAANLISARRLNQAERLLTASTGMLRSIFGATHRDIAMNYNHIGVIRTMQNGRAEEASRWFEQAFEMKRQCLGESHPDLIVPLRNLLAIGHRQGGLSELASWREHYLRLRRSHQHIGSFLDDRFGDVAPA